MIKKKNFYDNTDFFWGGGPGVDYLGCRKNNFMVLIRHQ